jgi:cell division protein FtsQ
MRQLTPDTILSLDDHVVPHRRRWVPPRWWRPLLRGVKVTLALVIGAGVPAWAWQSGAAAEAGLILSDLTIRASAQAGLTVQDVLVQGRERTRSSDLLAALQIQRGDPILGLDLVAAKERIEALPWVREAAVQRRLPEQILLQISEREPIALWQNQGEFILVDAEGTPIPDTIAGFAGLPLVVGDDAPQHAASLIAMLATEPQIASRVKAAVRVAGRRWNLVMDRLEGGIDVRLPEENPQGALQRLARLEREQRLLERSITAVDLRLPDRLVVRREGAEMPAAPAPKRKAAGKDA